MKKPYYELYETHVFQPEPSDIRLEDTTSGPQLEWEDEHGHTLVLTISEPTLRSLAKTHKSLVDLIDHLTKQRAALEAYMDGLSDEG